MDTTENAAVLEVGVVLGLQQAFFVTAGRCSADQAALILRIREEKMYKILEPFWDEFCPKYLKMCRSEADRIITLYEEFGPNYFLVAQHTRVSAETYRALAPAVLDGA